MLLSDKIILNRFDLQTTVTVGKRRSYYADYHKRARKCHYTFYRHDDGCFRSCSAVSQGRNPIRMGEFPGDGDLHGKHDPVVRCQCHLSFCRPYRKEPPHLPQIRSYDDLRIDCRILYSGMSDRAWRKIRLHPACPRVVHRRCRHAGKSLLDHLSQMVFFRDLYCNGLGMCSGIRTFA